MRRDVLARVLSPPRALVVRRRALRSAATTARSTATSRPDARIVAPFERGRPDASSAARGRAAAARAVASRVARARRASRRGATTSTGAKASLWSKRKTLRMGKQYVTLRRRFARFRNDSTDSVDGTASTRRDAHTAARPRAVDAASRVAKRRRRAMANAVVADRRRRRRRARGQAARREKSA